MPLKRFKSDLPDVYIICLTYHIQSVLQSSKKPETFERPRVGQSFYPSRSHTSSKNEASSIDSGTSRAKRQGRDGSSIIRGKDCNEKKENNTAVGDFKLKCICSNANSIVGKMDELKLRSKDCDVIGIVETWSNDSITDAELALNGFNMFRTDKKESNAWYWRWLNIIHKRCMAGVISFRPIGPQLL